MVFSGKNMVNIIFKVYLNIFQPLDFNFLEIACTRIKPLKIEVYDLLVLTKYVPTYFSSRLTTYLTACLDKEIFQINNTVKYK